MKFQEAVTLYNEAVEARSHFESEWQKVTKYILPSRGVYSHLTPPRHRKMTNKAVVNTVAEDALYVLASGMHSGLTSPSRPWFTLSWSDARLNENEDLKAWLQEATKLIHTELQLSNFYANIADFYTELGGFGVGCMYVGADSETDAAFRFELLTVGEYAYNLRSDGTIGVFIRVYFMTADQIYNTWPEKAPKEFKKRNGKKNNLFEAEYVILEIISRDQKGDFPVRQEIFLYSGSTSESAKFVSKKQIKLSDKGFYEFPYFVARWEVIGREPYSLGLGSRTVPDVQRLQEMEKAFLMATHKTIDPPVRAPARLKGQLNTLPGGKNYFSNPSDEIKELYQVRLDFTGVTASIQRIEDRIQRKFFNDIFLTGSRDPNASPYKAAEVAVREQEKMLRLGPVIEKLQSTFLSPMVERCFNILIRKKRLPELPPELLALAGSYDIAIISPLAAAQKAVALNGINSFLIFLGQMAQVKPEVLDNFNADEAAREYADITGVPIGVLRRQAEVDEIRKARAEQMAKQREQEQQLLNSQLSAEMAEKQANTQKTLAEAGAIMTEAKASAAEFGVR